MPITKTKISYHLDLEKELTKIKSKSDRTEAKRLVAELVLSQIESYTQAGVSPVSGGNFKALSKKYAKTKKKLTGNSDPDLHLNNEMISSIMVDIKQNGIDFKITDSKQKKKAFNHCTGDTLPKRSFLPNDEIDRGKEKNFAPDIRNGITQILRSYNADQD